MTYETFCRALEKRPDGDQEKVIRSLENTIVSAGAGSGKTQTLASRFAYLITADLVDGGGNKIKNPEVDRILTLTFTNKAASEMYQRIYKTLKRVAECSPDGEGRRRAQSALRDFSKARIQTLDSYSAGVLRQAAALYGIRPDFTAGADSPKFAEAAFDFVMERRNDSALQWILEPAKLEECAGLFAGAAAEFSSLADSANKEKRCSVFSRSLERQKESVQKKWLAAKPPLQAVEETIEKIQDIFPGQEPDGRATDWFYEIRDALDFWNGAKTAAARGFAKNAFLDKKLFWNAKALERIALSDECLLLQNALQKFNCGKKISDAGVNELVKNVLFGGDKKTPGIANEFCAALSFFRDIPYLEGLHALLDEFADRANDIKRKSGELTFKDVSELALLALTEQDDLRKQERDAYDFIMIDEFQDNNAANRELLLRISTDDGGRVMKNRLFFVGDEKQSIYKFRGADVSVFNSLAEHIKPCRALPMRRNYRSSDLLLEEFNQIFGGFLPDDSDAPSVQDPAKKIFESGRASNWRAKFDADDRAVFPETKAPEKRTGARTQVCLFPTENLNEDTELDKESAEALFIAQKILALREKGTAFKDIAVLVKSRTHCAELARIFSLNKIPFALDQQGNIFRRAEANDFYNAFRLAVYPSDINAFAAFLTSPFAGLSADDAQKILSFFPQKAFDPCVRAEEILDEAALQKYKAAQAFCEDFSRAALSSPIAQSAERLWRTEGYRFSRNAAEERYDLLFELARKADAEARDLSWFVDQLAAAKKSSFGKKDLEMDIKETDVPEENSDSVNVMTIHKSKGLEFDYVFAWGIVESGRGGNERSKIFESPFGPVVANQKKSQNLFSLLAKAENDDKEDAEARRLIYVALTRAAKGLFIVGSRPKESKIEGKNPLRDLIFSYEKDAEKSERARTKKTAEGAPGGISAPPFSAPFEYIEIQHYLRGAERPAQTEGEIANGERRALYQNAPLIERPKAENFWTSPSALEKSEGGDFARRGSGESAEKSANTNATTPAGKAAASQAATNAAPASFAYPQLNSFVNASALKKNEYGTLFHAFMEGWSRDFKNWTRERVLPEAYFERNPLVQKISDKNRAVLLDAFFSILERFLEQKENPALASLAAGRPFKAEHSFKTKIGSFIISGSMDALFQNADGTWTVLDYKTDAKENPALYYKQLACYKKTAADLEADGDAKKIRCVLFYAESGRFVDITEEAQAALEHLDDKTIRALIEEAADGEAYGRPAPSI